MSEMVSLKLDNAKEVKALFHDFPRHAAPGPKATSPAVIAMHDMWGLDESARANAEWLMQALRAFSIMPDLFDGKKPPNEEQAREWGRNMDMAYAVHAVEAADRFLRGIERHDKIAAREQGAFRDEIWKAWSGKTALVGFGLGAEIALAAACKMPEVNCVIGFYGVPRPGTFDVSKLNAAVMLHVVANDPMAPPEEAERLKREASARGKKFEVHVHSGTKYFPARRGFVDVFRSEGGYDVVLANEAWKRGQEMLNPILHPPLNAQREKTP
jgi:carboxymethylenebutenolidase